MSNLNKILKNYHKGFRDGQEGTAVVRFDPNKGTQRMMVDNLYPSQVMVVDYGKADGSCETHFDIGAVTIDDRIEEGDEVVLLARWMRKKDVPEDMLD